MRPASPFGVLGDFGRGLCVQPFGPAHVAELVSHSRMGPPSAKQINVHDSLDEKCACEHFLGKTVDQAELLFRQNALYYEEDLLFMGPVAFRYYVPAFVRYIQSEHSSGDPDAINCFAGLLELRSKKRREVAPIAGDLADACRYVLQHYDRLGVDPSIYGDLRPRYASLVSKLHEIQP